MPQSRCPRSECSGTSFEMAAMEPARSNYKYLAVQCAKCGAVVGVTEVHNTTRVIYNLANALGVDEVVLTTRADNQAVLPMVMAAGLRGRIRMAGDRLTVRIGVRDLRPLGA